MIIHKVESIVDLPNVKVGDFYIARSYGPRRGFSLSSISAEQGCPVLDYHSKTTANLLILWINPNEIVEFIYDYRDAGAIIEKIYRRAYCEQNFFLSFGIPRYGNKNVF